MAILECKECKGKVSDTAAACPHCGAPVPSPAPAPKAAQPAVPAPAPKASGRKISGWKIAGTVIAAFIVLSLIAGVAKDEVADESTAISKPDTPKPLEKIEALTMCQMLIKRAANDPEKAEVPYIEGSDAGGDFNFKWSKDSKLVRMRNSIGLEVGLPAFCSVNKETREFTQLNIDGKNIPLK